MASELSGDRAHDVPICPFCGFTDDDEYQLLLHVEISHSENGPSPFEVTDAVEASRQQDQRSHRYQQEVATQSHISAPVPSRPSSDIKYVDCPYRCGELIPAPELQFHTDFHLAEGMAIEEVGSSSGVELSLGTCNDAEAVESISNSFNTSIPSVLRHQNERSTSTAKPHHSLSSSRRRTPSLRELFFGSSPRKVASSKAAENVESKIKRLGRSELGPYAHEPRMPAWLQRMLEEGAKITIYNKIGPDGGLIRVEAIANETPGLVPVLSHLSLQDNKVARAFYSSPHVRHVAKMKNEGGFCGYRNIQMLISYIRDAGAPGASKFPGRIPSIIKLQDMIEQAWDKGFNAVGRIETGGIRFTRKYIGTPEAQALFQSLDIRCETMAFATTSESKAYLLLLQAIFEYFDNETDDTNKVVVTEKPPIYFQHRGHSMTIVGVEVQHGGSANLVVLDPMFNPSSPIRRMVENPHYLCKNPSSILKAHRRGESYLSKYKEFEILKIRGPVQRPMLL